MCNVDGLKKAYRLFLLYFSQNNTVSKNLFKTKRAMQNSLCLIVDNNCRARDKISLSGYAEISAKASTMANCKFEKVGTFSCRLTIWWHKFEQVFELYLLTKSC